MSGTKVVFGGGRLVWATVALLALGFLSFGAEPEAVKPLRDGHSHNDYWRKRPMLDALDHGFCSVEADVFLRDGQFWVGHMTAEILLRRNLETVYLQTLKERIERNGGTVYPGVKTFYLWIEFKEEPEAAWAALSPLLEKYKEMLCQVTDGVRKPGPVQVIITGNRPFKAFEDAKGKTFYATLDGRFGDLDNPSRPAWMVGAINENWGSVCSWRGKGPFPEDQRAKLAALVEKAHRQGRVLRFWGAPQTDVFWTELRRLKIDFINTDHLTAFRDFDRTYQPGSNPK